MSLIHLLQTGINIMLVITLYKDGDLIDHDFTTIDSLKAFFSGYRTRKRHKIPC